MSLDERKRLKTGKVYRVYVQSKNIIKKQGDNGFLFLIFL